MHIISKKTLVAFWLKHPDVKSTLQAWYQEAHHDQWYTPADIKKKFPSADFLPDNRVVFNLKHNKYRLIVRINYHSATIFIRFVGTHAEYDKIDAEVI